MMRALGGVDQRLGVHRIADGHVGAFDSQHVKRLKQSQRPPRRQQQS